MNSMKSVFIGIFVVIAIALIIFILLFLHPTVGDNGKTLKVRFTDIDKVNVGTRVTYAGKPVGEVVSIQEIPDARTGRIDKNGDVYVYELTLKVDSSVDVFNSDDISLRTSGLLGERSIAIDPQPLKPGKKLVRIEDEVIYASETGSVESTLKEFEELSKKVNVVLDDIHLFMSDIKEKNVVGKIDQTIQNVLEITGTLNQPSKWDGTLDNIFTLSRRVNESWTVADQTIQNIHHLTLRADESWNSLDKILENFQVTSINAQAFAEKANQIIDLTYRGEGTLGHLFVKNDLYLQLKSLLHKGETAMSDVNAYGILFQNDKRWQRLQAQRLRLAEKLANPSAFARYFNDKMTQISSSLSDVTMLLNETNFGNQSLLYQPQFVQRFSNLLQGVEGMEESLKMYNEQLVDQQE